MKLKFYHFYAMYEVGSFIHEMYKRKATSIRFELQESVGKVNIYIDDSSFKQIDGQAAWLIVKSIYAFIAKKTNNKEDFDKDKDFSATIDKDDLKNFNNKFKFKFLPLPKGKCLSYSYTKKMGDIYEVAISLVSNNLKDLINEKVENIQDYMKNDASVYMDNSIDNSKTLLEVDAVRLKDEQLKVYLIGETDDDVEVFNLNINELNSKLEVNEFFERFSYKEVVKETDDKPITKEKSKGENIVPKNYIQW